MGKFFNERRQRKARRTANLPTATYSNWCVDRTQPGNHSQKVENAQESVPAERTEPGERFPK